MALMVVGGAALSGFFQQVFVKLDSQEVKNFIRGKKQTDGLLKKLRIELMSVSAVYDDAEQKQLSNPVVKQWLHELKEAVFHAEDLLDEIKTEALRRKMEAEFGSSTSKVQDLISASFHAFDESIDTKIEEILETLSFISKQKDAFGLKERCSRRISQTWPSTSLVEGSNVYGRDHEKETIIQLLLSDDVTCNKIGVIPIVGMGGIGKTTLAQLLYNDDSVKQHFELQAWVCGSDEFDVVKITQTIYASVTSQSCDTTDLNELQVKLKDALAGKKFLFVLDDVWNENYNIWDSLKRPFESGVHGSKIIVTARNGGVASTMCTLQTHYLKHLLEEDCWSLFAKHAFKDASVIVDPNLEVIGRQIVSKCKGLPLAAKSLGGLLRSEPNVEEWENVLKSDIWELSDAKIEIMPALWLSYKYLSPELKHCFAYCSTFPKDYVFDKSELILLWMAEDLLQHQKKTRLEDVGKKYFDDLISRSFFQYSFSNDCFIMHDLMHDLATYVSGEFCIRLGDHDFSLDVVGKGRHFSYMQYSSNVDYERFDTIYEAKYLRTFILGDLYSLPTVRLDHLLMLQCLRVVKLRGNDISELPDSISNLKHLRYLDLCYTPIHKLPDAVCILYDLQTLLVSNCRYLAELPTFLRRLIHLRHLDFRGTKIKKMPPHMGKLKDLQTFGGEFVLSKDVGGNIDELKGFQHLRGNLHISGLQNITRAEDALEAKLRDKKLSEIRLKWEDDTIDSQNHNQVLGNLQPNTNLKVLAIEGYGGTKFPGWLGDESFSNLVTLRLETCGYCFSLPALGQLPSLKRLEIYRLNGVESVGSQFYGGIKPAFKSLEFLSFRSMQEWQEWCFPGGEEEEGGHFPNLCELRLHCCPKLTGKIPFDYFPRLERLILQEVNIESLACSHECNKFNIELPFLRELEISDCPNLVCFVGGRVLLAPNLKEISMCRFKNLWSVPEDMQMSLPSLPSLSIEGCKEFKSFPEESKFPSLDDLKIMECPEFVGFPHGGGLEAPNLKTMEIKECNKFRSLPAEMHASLLSLQSLSIMFCKEFRSFPEESKFSSPFDLKIKECPKFVGFHHEGGLQALNLKTMEIKECNKFRSCPEEMHTSLPSLQSLSIEGCKEFKSFPEESKFPSLYYLKIKECPEFVGFPHGGLQAPNLKEMEIYECNKFGSLPEKMHASLPSLQFLSIERCKEFKSFPEETKFSFLYYLKIKECTEFVGGGGLQAPNLNTMEIEECNKLRSLPSLRSLIIRDCPELESFPEGGLPSKLRYLGIRSCKKLMANRMRWGLQTLTSLKYLDVDFSKCEEEEIGESFPEEGLLPTTLTSLRISDHPNLKTIDGKALRHLISLETLKISFCPRLQSLPDEGLPTSLSRLDIFKCDFQIG
ncbi:putative disease resistance RPP13-like protein 1 [Pyrus x bretschneideri]|uniref:putative disease resistance RPP13-like protein 1 n=1 Tax=Pyrus x bretschneideri TaxID=225117 RepID=UPI0020307794|nr:putative disease resistance RPP13-like protein 1 [Pyrus x bretschneideri]XP_048420607.1 putative disease resistance RPP13-like protein 1 [Pyrus x bretschneideri]XP_048420608.1 putative disease resistance RPP13-like protein 1 [Pyrus x bretschneideri]XP_048420609.1 putative disease resistance RPP13-like protein 1 [Pyrus x bretschneideri]XP_048420610.1 putative disease resistance RPP13-like protein 1 [Pyrus x bretschneideri]XP_048420611.1 putative disease resistance RPP13-like protein 1 [Pyrus